MIKPIKVKYTDQYGGGMVIVTILSFKRYALAQLSFSLDENCGWPWLRIDVGLNQLLFNVLAEHLPKGIHYLENDFVTIQDWVFLGATLWTDFRNENALEMMEAAQCMNDYKVIRIGSNYRKLNPDDTLKFHKKSKQFLIERLEQFKDTKTWVLTHHAPSYQSVHPKYKSSGIANGAFVSDLDDLILNNPQIKYFSHGHTHESFDYMIGGCRVICNPRGYYNGYNSSDLNPNFDPNFEVEL
jgi:hypothetical protein